MQHQDYYVYVYCDPRYQGQDVLSYKFECQPFYIGYGRKNRLFRHLKPYPSVVDNNRLKINKIKSIQKLCLQPVVYKLNENLKAEEAQRLEKQLISLIGTIQPLPNIPKGTLVNLTPGGDGGATFCGKRLTEQHKQRISEANKNKVFSDETRKRLSESQKKRCIVMTDKKKKQLRDGHLNMSLEARSRIILASKNKIWVWNKILERNKRIQLDQLESFEKQGWVRGFQDNRKCRTVWVYHNFLKVYIKISCDQLELFESQGWEKKPYDGKKSNRRGSIWVYHGVLKTHKKIQPFQLDLFENYGWVKKQVKVQGDDEIGVKPLDTIIV